MKRLVTALGVDYVQWRALTRAYFVVDHAALFGTFGPAAASRAARTLIMMAVALGLIGASPAIFAFVCRDTLLAATVMTTTVSLCVAAVVLSQGSMIAAPDDFAIVGFRPVSSRTYFAVRLTAVLINTIGAAIVIGYPPATAFLVREHGSLKLAVAAAVAALATSLATTFLLMGVYGWLVQVIRPSLFTRVVGWLPIASILAVLGIFMAGAFQFMDAALPDLNLMEGFSLVSARLPRTTWMLAFPPVWFASYVEIARGTAGGFERAAALMSVVSLAGAGVLLRGRLSTAFASRVAQIASATAPTQRPRGVPWPFLRGEHRAIAIVMRSLARDDVAFQTQILMLVIAFLGIFGSMLWYWKPEDPFVTSSPGFFVLMAIGYLGVTFHEGLATSQAAEATWPFFTTPTDRVRLILAARDITAVIVLCPAVAVMFGILLHSFHHAEHAVVHSAAIAGLAFVELQLTVLWKPSVPFSVPAAARAGLSFRHVLINVPLLVFLALQYVGYRSRLGTAMGLVAIAVIIFGLERWLRRRIAR